MDLGFGIEGMDSSYEFEIVGEDLLGWFFGPEVVFAAIQDYCLGLVAGDDYVEIVQDVGNMGTAEPAV